MKNVYHAPDANVNVVMPYTLFVVAMVYFHNETDDVLLLQQSIIETGRHSTKEKDLDELVSRARLKMLEEWPPGVPVSSHWTYAHCSIVAHIITNR